MTSYQIGYNRMIIIIFNTVIMDRIKNFIEDNGLDFSDSGSSLNGNCVILAGFICHVIEGTGLTGGVTISNLALPTAAETELYRVFEFAYKSDYGNFWNTPEAAIKYKF